MVLVLFAEGSDNDCDNQACGASENNKNKKHSCESPSQSQPSTLSSAPIPLPMISGRKETEDCASTTVIWETSTLPCTNNSCNNDYEASSSNTSWNSIVSGFVEMGYSAALVEKAIEISGTENEEAILEYVLACQAADSLPDSSPHASINKEEKSSDNGTPNHSDENIMKTLEHDDLFYKDGDQIKSCLMEMGYSEIDVNSAIAINGMETPIDELIDFIDAQLCQEANNIIDESNSDIQEGNIDDDEDDIMNMFMDKGLEAFEEDLPSTKMRKRKQSEKGLRASKHGSSVTTKTSNYSQPRKPLKSAKWQGSIESEQFKSCKDLAAFKGLTGFGVPGFPVRCHRQLKPFMQGPPFFYFENVAIAPKDVWNTISRHFDGIDAEFVDSKFFCASRRPRGYVHNLPIEGRFQVLPLPPMTIHEALPDTKKYWPPWDDRVKFNCICTSRGSDVLCQRLRNIMNRTQGRPNISEQAFILEQCKRWNFVWVGPNQMAPLEPHEIELILGYEKDHTRGASSRTDRLACLGNSFQTDTVAYHLSALRPFYPDGIQVLSLFSGIGGAEVALHRVGISLKCVVAVEICPKNRLILRSWWKKTSQTGKLIEKEDVRHLTREVLEELVGTVGGFDLIIGGSPCNNISGNNRVCRDGLDGLHSSVFYEFPRILHDVRQIMQSRGLA